MKQNVLLGRGLGFSETPWQELEHQIMSIPQHHEHRKSFMSDEHHQVRDYIVRELVRTGVPLSPRLISNGLNISIERVNEILSELEKNLFFLARNEHGAVSWAFPITSDATAHRLTFSTGEQIYAA